MVTALSRLALVLVFTLSLGVFADEAQPEAAPAEKNEADKPKKEPKKDKKADKKEKKAESGKKQVKVAKKGMHYVVMHSGKKGGKVAANGQKVTVHYVGKLDNGKIFDSSISRGTPFSFQLGMHQVIPGWEIGVEGMTVGEKRLFIIPPQLAYGTQGVPGTIPPDSTLNFEVELLQIN